MKRAGFLLLGFLAAVFSLMACDDSNFAGFNNNGASNFTLLDANGDPIPNTFWSVNGNGFVNVTKTVSPLATLAFTDGDGDTCSDPASDTPQIDNGEAQQEGCTNSDGGVNIFCTPGTSMTLTVDDGAGNVDSETVTCPQPNGENTDVDFSDFTSTPAIVLFETSTVEGWELGDRAGADDFCEAAAPTLPQNTIRAILTFSGGDAIDDMVGNYGVPTNRIIRTLTGTQIADDWADLLDGSIDATLASGGIDGAGKGNAYWTGSSTTGGESKGGNCGDWDDIKNFGVIGIATATDGDWLEVDNDFCDSAFPILCIAFDADPL